MLRHDPPPHIKHEVGMEALARISEFCQASDKRAMRAKEQAFLRALSDWAFYALARNKSQAAQHSKEMLRLSSGK